MTYILAGLIARADALRTASPATPLALLEQGFAILPFPVGDHEDEPVGRFLWLTKDREGQGIAISSVGGRYRWPGDWIAAAR